MSGEIRVAIDARSLQDRPVGGVGRSVRGALPGIAELVELTALADARMPAPLGLPEGISVHGLRAPLSGRGVAWLQLSAPRWLRRFGGVFHCPFYGLPYLQPVPMVVTIHDLSFEFAPDWFPTANRLVFVRQARWGARTARMIIVHSEHVRESVLERYGGLGVGEERLRTIPLPVEAAFRPPADGETPASRALGLTNPYVVTIGGAPRRRLGRAVAAWRHGLSLLGAEPEELPLAVVGPEAPPSATGIRHLGVLSDADWASVLGGAAAFCYATAFEGYGMPALEAAACGAPIACHRVGSLPEVLDGAAAWAREDSADALGEALAGLLADPGEAAAIRGRGLERVRSLPDWAEVAARTAAVYRDAAGA